MDLRTRDNRLLRWASVHLEAFNTRHPWSHNDFFHPWLLRSLPESRGVAIDVGCGQGELLAQLALRFDAVIGIDTDVRMRDAAAARCRALPNVSVVDHDLTSLPPVDLVTMIAVLHHVDTRAALRDVARLLTPGGKFLCVGLAKPRSTRDLIWDLIGAITNPVIGVIKHPRARRGGRRGDDPFLVKDPELTFDELKIILDEVMPGARLRHRLGFRHTIEWTSPGSDRANESH